MRHALIATVAGVMLASVGFAQEAPWRNQKPIEIINTRVSSQPNDMWLHVEYTVRNISEKDVADYILVLTFLDEQERSVGSDFSAHESYFSPMRRVVLHKGEENDVSEEIPKSSIEGRAESITSVNIEPDFVRFTDRHIWGLNKSGRAFALGCGETGAAVERRRLREILATNGRDALLKDLSQETLTDRKPLR